MYHQMANVVVPCKLSAGLYQIALYISVMQFDQCITDAM